MTFSNFRHDILGKFLTAKGYKFTNLTSKLWPQYLEKSEKSTSSPTKVYS